MDGAFALFLFSQPQQYRLYFSKTSSQAFPAARYVFTDDTGKIPG